MFNYVAATIMMMAGLYTIMTTNNLIKKMIALSIFQTSVLLIYITLGKVYNADIPILRCLNYELCPTVYSNPLPHILMLTAIVVGVATLAVGLAIIVRIKESFGTIERDKLMQQHDSE